MGRKAQHQPGVPMSFDWADYLTLAQELADQAASSQSTEAKLRSAISRAYYAAFCKESNHLRTNGQLPAA